MSEYYQNNRNEWIKGGKYYYYKPIERTYKLTIKKQLFIISFD